MRLLLVLILSSISLTSYTQTEPGHIKKFSISGYITDKTTGEKLIGAAIYNPVSHEGTVTNVYGFFSLSLPEGMQNLKVNFLGYTPLNIALNLNENKTLNLSVEPSADLKQVEIVAEKGEQIQESSQMSMINIPVSQIKALPKFMGETDVLKVIQLLPGIKAGVEGTSGFYVRGGGPDQNLILLDGMPLYNVSHLFGFMSVFNGEAIQNVNITKGGFPAHYGGRLSSVLDINTKDGNQNRIKGTAHVGLIASSIAFDGPVVKGKSSFVVSARRTYLDALARPFVLVASKGRSTGGYFFHDINAKYTQNLDNGDKAYASLYYGLDKFYFSNRDSARTQSTSGGLGWGNLLGTLKWAHKQNDKLFANYTLGYTRYHFRTRFKEERNTDGKTTLFKADYVSLINDITARAEFDWYFNSRNFVKYGGWITHHTFKPGVVSSVSKVENESIIDTVLGNNILNGLEYAAFIEDDFKLGSRAKVNVGIHTSGFSVEKFYASIQPRISGRYLLNDKSSLKVSYSNMTQYLSLLSNAGVGLPTDLWVPVTRNLRPQQSNQWAVGYATSIKGLFEVSLESYYKTMNNLVEYKDGASYLNQQVRFDALVTQGKGKAYGTEFLIQKKVGKSTGWIGYTLSWANRQFADISQGKTFPYRYDRRHDVSVVFSHKLSDKIDFSFTWVYATGNALTLPLGVIADYPDNLLSQSYSVRDERLLYYGETRNSFRMGAYHRADASINFTKAKKYGNRVWNISVYNLYNRLNPFIIDVNSDYKSGRYEATQYSLFPIIPSISYSYEF